jgi:hypothetical protein
MPKRPRRESNPVVEAARKALWDEYHARSKWFGDKYADVKHPNGLTFEHVRMSPGYRADKAHLDAAFHALRAFNARH